MKSFSRMTYNEIKLCLHDIALTLKRKLPDDALFVVLVFDNATQVGRYTSNAHRGDIIKAMREYATVLEKMEDTPHT